MKNVKYPPDEELHKIAQEAFKEMRAYQVSGASAQYMGWDTKRESKSMYFHAFSQKSFVGEDLTRVFNDTWMYMHDETNHAALFHRDNRFCVRLVQSNGSASLLTAVMVAGAQEDQRQHVPDPQHSPVHW